MRLKNVQILKAIQVREGGFVYPLNPRTKLILDKKSVQVRKLHQLVYQQGEHYGTVGDCCTYLTNKDLLDLEAKGMIHLIATDRHAH